MNTTYAELRERIGEIEDLDRTSALLAWDQQVKMPPGGAGVRAEQLATLDRLAHEALTSDEIGRLLDQLAPYEESLAPESDEASLIRVVRRDWEKARRVPSELRGEMSRAASLAMPVWVKARQESDFSQFLPALRHNFDLRRRYVECFDDYDEPYDVLLDDFEPGMKTAEVRAVFDRLKEEQVPLVAAARAEGNRPARDATFPIEGQKAFELKVIERFGFNAAEWRLDPAVHPFASSIANSDIRLTTRYFESNLDSLFGTMHECGHGLYEHGVASELERTPLGQGCSLGLHESQSRMWENMVGRSLPFWRHFYPELQRTFPQALAEVTLEDWYRSVNWVEPSLIRVEADEATYNLHIILRFELEQELLADSVDLEDLPAIWNQRMQDYLGIEPPDDALGVLQDMHWAVGAIGYFSTYALGNVISGQLWERVTGEIPDLHDQFEQGEFSALSGWLEENLWRHGRKFRPREMVERITGGGLDPDPYLRYLRGKYPLATQTQRRNQRGDLMATRVGINGFGRIGRNFFRAQLERKADIEIVAANDLGDEQTMAHLLKYDSTLGPLDGDVGVEDGVIHAAGEEIKLLSERDPGAIPWGELGVDVVLESTGFFTKRDGAQKHLDAGAKKVVISAPATDPDLTVVLGVNDETYDKDSHHIVSNASCTTNCVAPMAKVLHDGFTIEQGFMTTIHAYTADQRLQDMPHDDLRRARAAAINLIPTSTGAARAIGVVLPELKGKVDGMSMRAPVPTGSVTDLVCRLGRETSVDEVNEAFKAAAAGALEPYLQYTEDALVSSDIQRSPYSCIFDSELTMANGSMVKVFGWYDNEWGYSCRLVDLIGKLL